MTYDDVKSKVARHGVVNDGYNGKTTRVGFAFHGGLALAVTEVGYYRANGYRYSSEAEMLHCYDNHTSTHFPQVRR